MLKYVNTQVTFAEVPDEITLCINISGCPCRCKGCHSEYLAEDIGEELNEENLSTLIDSNKGITCVAFMGGDKEPWTIHHLAMFIRVKYPKLKTAWYSGRDTLPSNISLNIMDFNYIKLGSYKEELGPLNSRKTNQRLYRVMNGGLLDLTHKFWKGD